ncbi:MAG: hypothetical protein IPK50_18010 [Fibrobacterota bacterium]|nr:hypothetical protein [Fibrobacterota bacterium]QQS04165.1 MAG: hypothetical protein IPK50_18010 [Fibrobacterota bacterium]
MIFALLATLALVGVVLFVPVWIRVRVVLDAGKIQFLLMPWGLSIGGGRLLSWISRQLESLVHRLLSPKPKAPQTSPSKPKPKRSWRRLPWKFILWMAGRALALVAYLTRRLTFRVAGWDPAMMGVCQGALGGVLAGWGVRKVRWESDFSPRPPYAELTWDVGSSLAGLCLWGARTALRMPSR